MIDRPTLNFGKTKWSLDFLFLKSTGMLIKFPLHQISSLLCLLAPTNDLPALIISCSRYLLTCKGSGGVSVTNTCFAQTFPSGCISWSVSYFPSSGSDPQQPMYWCLAPDEGEKARSASSTYSRPTHSLRESYFCLQPRQVLPVLRDQAKSQSGKAKLEKLANDMEQFMALAYHLRTSPLGWINYFPEKQELETVRRSWKAEH